MLEQRRTIYKTLFYGILFSCFVFLGTGGAILNPPHDATNGINCDSCHFDFSNTPAWWNTAPANLDDVPVNRVCWQAGCHDGTVNPFIKTHSSEAMGSNKYGVFTFECINCHNPHVQRQVYHNEYPAGLSGTITGVDAATQTFTLDISLPDRTGDADPADDYVGWTIVPHIPYKTINYKIASNTATTVTVTGAIDTNRVFPGTSAFGILVGRYVKAFNPTPSGQKTVKFFVSEGANSFADGDATREGVCEVCHTRTENPSTNVARHRNNAHDDTHYEGQRCIQCHAHTGGFGHGGGGTDCVDCHGHDAGTLYDADMSVPYTPGAVPSPGNGTYKSHSTHTERDSDDLRGPGIYCNSCHDITNFPYFNSGTDTSGDGNIDLSETDVCDGCHSPNGAFDGVNSSGGSVGAKDNWANGVYTGSNLTDGKEKWCVDCHDQGTSVIGGRQAPDVAGDDVNYGFYKSGHGSALQECGACHGLDMDHNFDGQQTYAVPGPSYKVGYRLKDVNGNDPLNIPYVDPFECRYDPTDYELCYSCHSEQNLLNDTRAVGYLGCTSNPFDNAASITTNYKDVLGGEENIHSDHLISVSAWFFALDPTPKWDSDRDGATYDSGVSCITCHNPHGPSRPDGINPTKKMTVTGLDIIWDNDANGDFGQVGPLGNVNNTCWSGCHAPNGGKYYRTHPVPPLDSIMVTDNNPADPAAAEAGYTNSTSVSVAFTLGIGFTPTQMRLAEDFDFTVNDTGWIGYSSPYTYTLSASEGSKTVYAKIRDGVTTSGIRADTIILDTIDPVMDSSTLTSPNGGENWKQDSSHDITWGIITDDNFSAGPISLDYSTDSGGSYPNSIAAGEANDGTYSWTVSPVESSNVRVRLTATDRAGNQASDSSDADFTIEPVAAAGLSSITITDNDSTDPEAAEAGYTNNQTVAVSLSVSNNPTDMILAENPGFSVNSTGWIPFNATATYTLTAGDGSKTVYAKVRNILGESGTASDAIILDTVAPTIQSTTLTAPDGGEFWPTGSSQTILWSNGDITDANLKTNPITLEYSTNSGASYSSLIASGEANDGSYTWNPLPATANFTSKVRITASDKAGNALSDFSDNDFFISPPYIVTTTNDSGAGSLRQVMSDLVAAGGNNTIWFNIAAGSLINGVAVIPIGSNLPDLSQPNIMVDGNSQAALVGDTNPNGPEVRIDGGGSNNAFIITGNNATIKSLQLTNLSVALTSTADNTVIEGCYFGFSADTGGYANQSSAVNISFLAGATNSTIGGSDSGATNYISCATSQGIRDYGSGNRIMNNVVGLLPDGTLCANDSGGLFLGAIDLAASFGCLVQDNTICGSSYGIKMDPDTENCTIKSNLFGLTYSGGVWNQIGPSNISISVTAGFGSGGNITIGGPNVATDDDNLNDSNVIHPGGTGISIATHAIGKPDMIFGNFIGTNPEEDENFGATYGIQAGSASDRSLIGGGGPGEAGNVIAHMSFYGVYLLNTASDNIQISRNSFYDNGDEVGDDAIFLVAGANNNTARPNITAATTTTVTVVGVLSGETVEVYISDCVPYGSCADGTIYGEGMTFVGSAVSGGASVDVPVSGINVGDWVTAIRIQADLDTSPFSSNFQVP
jgi:hypothetical protein